MTLSGRGHTVVEYEKNIHPKIKSLSFRSLLLREQEKIRRHYEKKLDEIEKEREQMEEDKTQSDRYKTLLIKQRDIMIQLTARLNERDQSVSLSFFFKYIEGYIEIDMTEDF